MSETDETLVLQSQAGNRSAFEELVRRTARLVFARLYLDTGRSRNAEDLAQETYLVAWRSIRQVTEPAGFRKWLLAIAHNVFLDSARRDSRLKRKGSRADSDVLGRIASTSPGPDASAEEDESRQRALDLLRALPEEYRLPLMLRYLDDCDYESISLQLGLTNGSLRGLLHRGMTLLRERAAQSGLVPVEK